MSLVLVDSSVILDVLTEDAVWFDWSSGALAHAAETGGLAINPVVYAEVSVRFDRIEDLEDALAPAVFARLPIPWEAAFLAGKCYLRYRREGGRRTAPLPDFFIGAHAAVGAMRLLTRDASRFSTYFPGLEIIAP
jgi:predicted nucleic acid-binding protein